MPHYSVNGFNLHYRQRGGGLPVVLVHGFPLDGRIWERQLEGLSEHYRVIVPDLRGFGQSANTDPFTIESLADDLYTFLAGIGALPCVLGGLSMGGYVTFAFLSKYASKLKGLMLIDTKCEADGVEAKAARLKMIEDCRHGGAAAVAKAMEPKMMDPSVAIERPKLLEQLRQIMIQCSPITIEHALLAMRQRNDYRDKLASIAVPTLIVVGQTDAFAPPELARAMGQHIPHSQLAVIPDAGHMAPMEQPELVNQTIREFLAQLG